MNVEGRYTLKRKFWICYFLLLFIGVVLTILRWLSVPITDFFFINPETHSYISNFSLSMIFYLAIGNSWLITDDGILDEVKEHYSSVVTFLD